MGSGPQIDRYQGIQNILKKYPDIKIVANQPADFQRAKGQSVMENILQANKSFDAVISESGESLAGAIDAMKAANRLNGLIIENIDGYNGILKYIKEGVVDSTSLYPAGLGKDALLTALKVLNGDKVEKLTSIENIQVTKDNVDKYYDSSKPEGAWTY
jgi:ABC-type sugar transport system substrate-binding protein